MTTPMQSNCPHCGQPHLIAPQQLGQPLQCTRCGKGFTVGGPVNYAPPMVGATQTNGMAIASLICGLLFCIPISGILAVVFGILGLLKTKDPQFGGKGMAIAGIVLGSLGGVLIVPVMLISILLPSLNRARETANRVKCASNLREIGRDMQLYANDFQGAYPPSLGALFQAENVAPQYATCPDTNTSAPANLSGSQLATWVDANSDYIYIAGGLKPNALANAPSAVIAYEKDANHNGQGMNLLYADGTVMWFKQWDAHKQINLSPTTGAVSP